MRKTPSATARLPLTSSVVALASIGTLAVAQAPHFQRGFALVFALVAVLRLTMGRDGQRLLPTRVLQAVGFSVAAMSLAYVLHRLGGRAHVEGPNALWALMEMTCMFEALVLLWRQRAFSSFLIILFSSVHATGMAFAVPETTGLLFVGAYVVVLAWTLVVFERGAALEEEPTADTDGAVLRVRAAGTTPLPWRTALRTTAVLLVFGLPLGALLYLAAPRNWELPGNLGARASRDRLDHDGGLNKLTQDDRAASEGYVIGTMGPGEGGAPLGSVAEIKRNLEKFFEVSLEGRERLPPMPVLRAKVSDVYYVNGTWDEALGERIRPRIHRDWDDNESDGWIPLQYADAPGPRTTLRIELLKGGNRRLYLQPREVAVKIRRDGRILAPAEIVETGDEALSTRVPLKAGDVVLQRYVNQPNDLDTRLVGRRSDSAVAPQTVYLQMPPAVRESMLRHATRVVGSETDPWRRARLLEGWLRSEAFTYTLKVPKLDRKNPIVDFMDRTRSGHCEPFAYALTLMLRALGHPARYVRGFWGGDVLAERKSIIVRGSHFHAWSEMYLDGVGWVALNPTPPDRRAADAGSITAAEDAPMEVEDEWSFDFLGMDDSSWQRFWQGIGHRVDAWILAPLSQLFRASTGYAGVWISLLLLLIVTGRRRARRYRRMVVAPGRRLPAGAYGQALLLLARKGVRRPTAWTVREFAAYVGKRFPAAAAPFGALSRAHEAHCYGGGEEDRRLGRAPLDALRAALRGDTPD
ncbi:MAG: transglutaminase domain-containing protein [Planctomycetota bacterium]|nr:transglutaminase domain-containing protein [Planctomycetota bacterium]